MIIRRHHNVKIYTKNGSMLSDLAKKFFNEVGIDYTEYNINSNNDYSKELMEVSGDVIIPTVDFDGRIIAGYQPDVYNLILKASEAIEKQSAKQDKEDNNKLEG